MADPAINFEDPNEFNALYLDDMAQVQERYNDLNAALQDIQANPQNYEDAEYLTGELTKALQAQKSQMDYIQAISFKPMAGYGSLGDEYVAHTAWLNQVAPNWQAYMEGRTNQLAFNGGGGITQQDVLNTLNRAKEIRAYSEAYGVQNPDALKAKMIEDYYIVRPNVEGLGRDLTQYYYGGFNPETGAGRIGGQVGQAINSSARNIYADRERAVKFAGARLSQAGMLDSGTSKRVQRGINARALSGIAGAADDATSVADAKRAEYSRTAQDYLGNILKTENEVRMGAYGKDFGSGINQYLRTAKSANQKSINDIYAQAQTDINKSGSAWSDLGAFVGNVGSIALKGV